MELAEVLDGDLAGAWERALAGVTALQSLLAEGVVADDDLLGLQVNVEYLARRIGSLQVGLQAEIGRRSLHRRDGHATAKVMARHRLGLSDAEAARRAAAAQALRDLPEVRAAYEQGEIGACQVQLIASVHRNPRVREQLPAQEAELVRLATTRSFRDLAAEVREWERLADADGAFTDNERNHERRDARLGQNGIDLSWFFTGQFGAEQGARLREIFDHYIEAEWEADWAEARARLGDAATLADLVRTDGQRRADALDRIFSDAAGAPPGTRAPKIVHTIMWSAQTYFRLLDDLDRQATGARWTNERPGADQPGAGSWAAGPAGSDQAAAWWDPATYRCETVDGVPLEPMEAMASSLANHVRRVVVDAQGVVIDLGRAARLFTGSARTAAKLQHPRCIWPGCEVPASRCEADHLHPHARGGGTNPANGAPLCGFHNRWKQKGYATARGPDGTWHTHRPDGTEIT